MPLRCPFCVCQFLSWDDPLKSYAFQGTHPPLAYRASGVSWMNCKKFGTITIAHTRFDLYELLDRSNWRLSDRWVLMYVCPLRIEVWSASKALLDWVIIRQVLERSRLISLDRSQWKRNVFVPKLTWKKAIVVERTSHNPYPCGCDIKVDQTWAGLQTCREITLKKLHWQK